MRPCTTLDGALVSDKTVEQIEVEILIEIRYPAV
jgi:hypothetical protein